MHRVLPLSVTLLASGVAACAHTQSAAGTLALTTVAAPATVLHQYQRTVWSDQVVWTQQYVAAAFANDRTARADLAQLARNQEAIGQIIKPYYGETAGDALTTMLNRQVLFASALVQAVKTDNAEQKEFLETRLHENSNAIARFLARLNPYWSPTELESMFNRYVDVSAVNVIARKGEHVDGDETAADGSLGQAKKLADVLSDGIMRQFPSGPPYYPLDTH